MKKLAEDLFFLQRINSPADLKQLNISQLQVLAEEIREKIISQVAAGGGHLSSNLGTVELTLALHYVFEAPEDLILWDVGHQTYTHKLITGRRDRFHFLRQNGGLSGFPSREESAFDVSNVGHASTALSQALGLRAARDIKGRNHKIIAVMGDGALTGGLAMEALNNAGQLQKDLILILNDNEHSIARNVGALARNLAKLRSSRRYRGAKQLAKAFLHRFPRFGRWVIHLVDRFKFIIKAFFLPSMLFESFGFSYLGPIDGHDLKNLIEVMTQAKNFETPVLLHVITKKGKGYPPAEQNPVKYHSAGPFDIKSGEMLQPELTTFTDVTRTTLVDLGRNRSDLVCITAAMADGTGLDEFARLYPERFFDVGIAEEHALSFASGLSLGGMRPVVAIYSTFFQRSFDQMLEDICLQNLPILVLLDRAGLVPGDGPTHQGIYDLSFLRLMPNLSILAPSCGQDLKDMIYTSLEHNGPVAIRYPKGEIPEGRLPTASYSKISWGRGKLVRDGDDLAFLALGSTVDNARQASLILDCKHVNAAVFDLQFLTPLDRELILDAYHRFPHLVVLEENVIWGGLGSAILEFLNQERLSSQKIHHLGISRTPGVGSRLFLLQEAGLTAEQLACRVLRILGSRKEVIGHV